MKKSATQLGEDYCLIGEEMNYILKAQGYLEGEPGDYDPTPKGMPYVQETSFHRGNGGYANYNRYWITRKWDDSILEELDLSEEVISEARAAVADRRRLLRENRKAESEALRAEHNQINSESFEVEEFSEDELSDVEKVCGLIGLVVLIGVGTYRWVAPKAKNLWNEKIAPKIEAKRSKKVCQKCTNKMRYDKNHKCWICTKCGAVAHQII